MKTLVKPSNAGRGTPKKPSRKSLVKKLDKVFSLFIRARDERCVVCGSTEQGTNGHLWTSQAYSTRWDEKNCNQQCWPCNYRHEFDPYPYQEWFRKKYGQAEYDRLHLQFATIKKFKDYDLLDLIEHYKNILDKQATEE